MRTQYRSEGPTRDELGITQIIRRRVSLEDGRPVPGSERVQDQIDLSVLLGRPMGELAPLRDERKPDKLPRRMVAIF